MRQDDACLLAGAIDDDRWLRGLYVQVLPKFPKKAGWSLSRAQLPYRLRTSHPFEPMPHPAAGVRAIGANAARFSEGKIVIQFLAKLPNLDMF